MKQAEIRPFEPRDEDAVVRLWKDCGLVVPWNDRPKINLQVRTSNTDVITFYKNLGFKTDDVVSLGKRLEPDD